MKAAWKHYIGWLACEFKLHKWEVYRYNDSNTMLKECKRCHLIRSL